MSHFPVRIYSCRRRRLQTVARDLCPARWTDSESCRRCGLYIDDVAEYAAAARRLGLDAICFERRAQLTGMAVQRGLWSRSVMKMMNHARTEMAAQPMVLVAKQYSPFSETGSPQQPNLDGHSTGEKVTRPSKDFCGMRRRVTIPASWAILSFRYTLGEWAPAGDYSGCLTRNIFTGRGDQGREEVRSL